MMRLAKQVLQELFGGVSGFRTRVNERLDLLLVGTDASSSDVPGQKVVAAVMSLFYLGASPSNEEIDEALTRVMVSKDHVMTKSEMHERLRSGTLRPEDYEISGSDLVDFDEAVALATTLLTLPGEEAVDADSWISQGVESAMAMHPTWSSMMIAVEAVRRYLVFGIKSGPFSFRKSTREGW